MGWPWRRNSKGNRPRPRAGAPAGIEALEPRVALSASPPNLPAWERTATLSSPAVEVSGRGGNQPLGTPGPRGFTPAQVRQAYGLDTVSFGTVPADGRGTTIAIVTAFDSPNVAADLATFSATFGLPGPPSFTKVNQNGGSKLPAVNAAWATEACIDVQWAHAIAPGASIVLVEASSNSDADLMTAVRTARSMPGVVAVSMSWGRGEYAGERVHDPVFTTPAGQEGVTFFAASGDNGAPGLYPAASANVVAVGGTSLSFGAGGQAVEAGWRGSGGGVSTQVPRPAWQGGVVPATAKRRALPDVSLVADPATGLAVVDSRAGGAANPWAVYGGTSIAAPQWAGLAAIVAQGRRMRGATALDGATQFLPALYSLPAGHFRDVTAGGSAGVPRYSATVGFDFVTGRGSPHAALLVRDLVAWGTAPAAPSAPGSLTARAVSPTSAGLGWKASVGAEGYRLFEIVGGKETLAATYGPGVTEAVVSGLVAGRTYSWRLEAWNGSGTASATAQATLPAGLVAPTGLSVRVLGRTTVQVSWTPSKGATAHSVYAFDGVRLWRVATAGSRATTLRVTGLPAGSTLYFAVRAENGADSATAGWVKATLPG